MKKVLVVVDYQNDFVDGSLGFPGAENIETEIIKLIKKFKDNNDLVVFTLDTHCENYMDTVEGKNLPIKHCIKGTYGHQLRDKLLPLSEDCEKFIKYTFPSLELGNHLKTLHPDEVYLCGLVSDICVFSNAIIAKAACPDARIVVMKDASGSPSKDVEEQAYNMLKHLHIEII